MEMLSNILIQCGDALPQTCEMLSLSFVFGECAVLRSALRLKLPVARTLPERWRLLLLWLARRRQRRRVLRLHRHATTGWSGTSSARSRRRTETYVLYMAQESFIILKNTQQFQLHRTSRC